MTVLRNILDDLVEKKLWPIAVALVVALIALPLAFGGGGSGETVPAPRIAPDAGGPIAGAANAVSLEADPAVDKRTRKGTVRNPFKQLAKSADAAHASSSPVASTGGSSTSAPSAAVPGVPGGSGTGSATATPAAPAKTDPSVKTVEPGKPATDDDDRAAVVFRFAERGEEPKRFDDPRKLTGMPSASYPLLVFAGVRSDGKALRFVVNPLTRVTGDGRCRPSRDRCRTLEVRPGGTALIDVLQSPTKLVKYRLDVVRAER